MKFPPLFANRHGSDKACRCLQEHIEDAVPLLTSKALLVMLAQIAAIEQAVKRINDELAGLKAVACRGAPE